MDQQLNWRVSFSVLLVLVHVTYSQLQCPSDIYTNIQYGATETTVQWEEPVPPPDYILVFQSYSQGTFRVGISYVEYIYEHPITTFDRLSCSFQVIVEVEDRQPPVISNCPASPITVVYEVGLTGHAGAEWVEPSATDNTGEVILVERTAFPGEPLYVDAHPTFDVTYAFEDPFQNRAYCQFQIRFEAVDTTPPTIHNCPNIVTKVIPLQQNGTFVSWDALEVTDNSERFILRIEPEIQSNYFTTGLTEVQYIYTDLSGNSASCFVNIHVIERDVTPPDITHCPTSIIFGVKPGIMETFVHWDPPTATDNSGTVFTEVHEREGIYSVDTVLVVVYKFYDANYNEAVCTFQVSVVEDDENPIIVGCPTEDISDVIRSDDKNATVNWMDPIGEDTTFIANVIQSHYPGNNFRVGNTTVEYLFIDSAGNNASCKFNVVLKYEQTEVSSGNDIIIIVLIVCLTVVIVVVVLVLAFVINLRHSKEVNTPRPNSKLPATPGIPNESYTALSARRPLPPSDNAGYLTPSPN
ncbi:hyalin-like [Apostichopus japonicus]|uniref:hyalin-like n=1 Tax=Stichopus japonicus TaxID=307972 RepID=UPI003AB1E974